MHKAVDEVRAQEARALRAQGREAVLTHTRWCLLKRPENLTEKQEVKLAELLRYNLKAVRTYLLKQDFQFFWDYRSPSGQGSFGSLVYPGLALSPRADKESGSHVAQASGIAAELVSGQKENFQRRR